MECIFVFKKNCIKNTVILHVLLSYFQLIISTLFSQSICNRNGGRAVSKCYCTLQITLLRVLLEHFKILCLLFAWQSGIPWKGQSLCRCCNHDEGLDNCWHLEVRKILMLASTHCPGARSATRESRHGSHSVHFMSKGFVKLRKHATNAISSMGTTDR